MFISTRKICQKLFHQRSLQSSINNNCWKHIWGEKMDIATANIGMITKPNVDLKCLKYQINLFLKGNRNLKIWKGQRVIFKHKCLYPKHMMQLNRLYKCKYYIQNISMYCYKYLHARYIWVYIYLQILYLPCAWHTAKLDAARSAWST